jgi:hypothetical protein
MPVCSAASTLAKHTKYVVVLSKTKEVARIKGAGLGLIAPATAESKQMERATEAERRAIARAGCPPGVAVARSKRRSCADLYAALR